MPYFNRQQTQVRPVTIVATHCHAMPNFVWKYCWSKTMSHATGVTALCPPGAVREPQHDFRVANAETGLTMRDVPWE